MNNEQTKITDLFDKLDNVLGNYQSGSATADDIAYIAYKVNQYLLDHPHPHDLFQSQSVEENKKYEYKEINSNQRRINYTELGNGGWLLSAIRTNDQGENIYYFAREVKLPKVSEERMYTKGERLKQAFDAGKECAIDHPDDDTYDDVRFDIFYKSLSKEPVKKFEI